MTYREISVHLGEKIKKRRESIAISRSELAGRSGFSESIIARFEDKGLATLKVIIMTSIALDCSEPLERLYEDLPNKRTKEECLEVIRKQVRTNSPSQKQP